MRRLTLAPLMLLIGAVLGCAPQSGALSQLDTGISGTYTRQIPISRDAHHVLMGHVIEVSRDGETVRALVISQRRDGVHRLSMREAWSSGIRLPFRATHRMLDGCTHGHCRDTSVGMIFLSDPLFAIAAQRGLRAYLVGGQGNIAIFAPAELFSGADP